MYYIIYVKRNVENGNNGAWHSPIEPVTCLALQQIIAGQQQQHQQLSRILLRVSQESCPQ